MERRVSVALCTRNGEAHVEAQVRSILAQTRLPDELVVSDDASTDRTLAIVESIVTASALAGRAVALVVLENAAPLGVTANFQQALEASSGDFIALCDQDDIWHPDRLSSGLAVFDHDPTLQLVHSDARLVDESGEPLGSTLFQALDMTSAEKHAILSGSGFSVLLQRNLVTGATTIVRRELVALASPFPGPWVHDEWLAAIAGATGAFTFVPEPLIDYRQHGSNQIGVRKLSLRGKLARVFQPVGDRPDYLVKRAQVLLDRLVQMQSTVPAFRIAMVRGKLSHLQARQAYDPRRSRRWVAVLREVGTGRYTHYSRGLGDILRDLFNRRE